MTVASPVDNDVIFYLTIKIGQNWGENIYSLCPVSSCRLACCGLEQHIIIEELHTNDRRIIERARLAVQVTDKKSTEPLEMMASHMHTTDVLGGKHKENSWPELYRTLTSNDPFYLGGTRHNVAAW